MCEWVSGHLLACRSHRSWPETWGGGRSSVCLPEITYTSPLVLQVMPCGSLACRSPPQGTWTPSSSPCSPPWRSLRRSCWSCSPVTTSGRYSHLGCLPSTVVARLNRAGTRQGWGRGMMLLGVDRVLFSLRAKPPVDPPWCVCDWRC